MTVAERFWSKVRKSDGCWEWQAATNGGYGWFRANGRSGYAHRHAWTMSVGPIPDGLFVLHHCDNPPCVRLDHLYLGTKGDNVWDCIRRNRTNFACGERINKAKLTAAQVRMIRAIFNEMPISTRALGRLYGVQGAHKILRRQLWAHVN